MEDEIIELETKIAYLENTLMDLQSAEEENRKNIQILKDENRVLKSKIKEILENMDPDIPSRRPPHY